MPSNTLKMPTQILPACGVLWECALVHLHTPFSWLPWTEFPTGQWSSPTTSEYNIRLVEQKSMINVSSHKEQFLLAYSQITRLQSFPIQCSLIFYFIHKLGIWTNAKVHLLNGTLGLEENAPPQQLSEDAAHGPDVDGVGVVAAPHEDLRSPVILCHNFLSHVPCLVRLLHSGQAKIADLESS